MTLVFCRHQHKRLAALEMERAHANHKVYVGKYSSHTNGTRNGKRILVVIGLRTGFGRKIYRDAVRKSWLPSGATLKKLEQEKGILVQFVIGRRLLLRTYAHDDVSIESWMIGLDVKHVNEGKLCCSSWSPGFRI
ncbi:Hexosyltransferase [Rhynchospora pubera]|uniref:Hexosyltransferase n=1 Tax=Rhynchospora pubera TaxID=906938 RepID=A0AAV8E7Y2_9POAL|nr:Hexosyltransferase [Rhynchospora pubera]